MKLETLGWSVFAGLAAIAVVLWLNMPRPAIIIGLLVVIAVAARLILGKRM